MTPEKARLLVKLLTDGDTHLLTDPAGREWYTVDFLEEVTRGE